MSDYNIDLGEWGLSSVPALMAKIVGLLGLLCKQKKRLAEINWVFEQEFVKVSLSLWGILKNQSHIGHTTS